MSDPITLIGYSDRLSASVGESLQFKVSSRAAQAFDVCLVRVIHADANPAGPGLKFEALGTVFSASYPSRFQPLQTGSYAISRQVPAVCSTSGLTFGVRFQPTALQRGSQCLVSQRGDDGFSVVVDAEGVLFTLYQGAAQQQLRFEVTLMPVWYDLALSYDAHSGRVLLAIEQFDQGIPAPLTLRAQQNVPTPFVLSSTADLLLGAEQFEGSTRFAFNGRLEQPCLFSAPLALGDVIGQLPTQHSALYSAWDFTLGIDTLIATDSGPHGRHAHLHNLPSRAVTGSRWDASEMCWRHAPEHYAAIHFHDDDLYDAAWQTDFTFTVPAGLASGSYAMHISVGEHVDYLPFYVRPALGKPTAKVLFVAPTYTYQAYANFARGNYDAALKAKVAEWGAYPHNPDEHREYGLSTYNLHSDGSGVYFSSRLRPMLTMRPGFMTFNDAKGSGCRHYIADSHLLDWLEQQGIAFDIVTDEDLQSQGAALMAPYACVLTGTHPEYHTEQTLDAFAGYQRGGGNLCYLGGNGFYWRIGRSDSIPGVLEMRRSENGTRAWAAPSGEYFHALDGQYSGLWRNSGRTPNQLVGIGFVAQGPYESSHFRVLDEAREQPGGWILEGIEGPILGDYGLCAGGAAGFELDAAEAVDGSPARYTVLARSEGHGPGFGVSLDCLLSHLMTLGRGQPEGMIRAEMIHYHTGHGGQVFAVGSITFCGALSHNHYRNDVSTLLRNVVLGFSQPHSQEVSHHAA